MVNHRRDVRCVINLDQATERDRARVASGGPGLRRNLDNGAVINAHTQTVQMTTSVHHVVKRGKHFSVFLATYLPTRILIHQLHQCLEQVPHVIHQNGYVHNAHIVTVHQILSASSAVIVRLGMSQCVKTAMR